VSEIQDSTDASQWQWFESNEAMKGKKGGTKAERYKGKQASNQPRKYWIEGKKGEKERKGKQGKKE